MAKIRIKGVEYDVPEDFDMGELADMEEITGQGYDMTKPGVRGMVALAYVAIKRKDPRVTIDDVRAMKLADIEAVEEDAPSIPPAQPSLDESDEGETTTSAYSENGSADRRAVLPPATGAPV